MKNNLSFVLMAVIVVAAGLASPASAGLFQVQFTVTDFEPSNGNPPPHETVSGSIIWQANNIHGPIQSFQSISLTLDGYTYSPGELGYVTVPPNWSVLGPTRGQPNGISNLTDDFYLVWETTSLTGLSFAYASSQRSGIWSTHVVYYPDAFTQFSITPVPEPTMASLLASGLILLGAARFRSRRP
jgi:hypothetical protein